MMRRPHHHEHLSPPHVRGGAKAASWARTRAALRARLVRTHRRRGVTLFEVLIVVAIMALIAGGVGFMLLPEFKKAQIKTSRTAAHTIRTAALNYITLEGFGDCPTIQTLVDAKKIDPATELRDPWGNDYTIVCAGDDVTVSSKGPDGKDGSEDDIVVGTAGGGDA